MNLGIIFKLMTQSFSENLFTFNTKKKKNPNMKNLQTETPFGMAVQFKQTLQSYGPL